VSEGARHWLVEAGYDPSYGARPIKWPIQKFLEGSVVEGQTVLVDVYDDKLAFVLKVTERGLLGLQEKVTAPE